MVSAEAETQIGTGGREQGSRGHRHRQRRTAGRDFGPATTRLTSLISTGPIWWKSLRMILAPCVHSPGPAVKLQTKLLNQIFEQ